MTQGRVREHLDRRLREASALPSMSGRQARLKLELSVGRVTNCLRSHRRPPAEFSAIRRAPVCGSRQSLHGGSRHP